MATGRSLVEYLPTTWTRSWKPLDRREIHKQESPILRLPRELRDEIFSYLLVEPRRYPLVYEQKALWRYSRTKDITFTPDPQDPKPGPEPGSGFYDITFAHRNMVKLSKLCKQFSQEAQEMFFTRNRHMLHTLWGVPKVLSLHARWISKVSLWCQPNVEHSSVLWMHVVVERVDEFPFVVFSWNHLPYEDEANETRHDAKLSVWTRTCERMMMLAIQRGIQRGQHQMGAMDLKAIVDVLGQPPMCKKMHLTMHPAFDRHRGSMTSRGRDQRLGIVPVNRRRCR